MNKIVHVAVAVIINTQNEVLLAFRQAHQHQANLWEFPGGKVEANETVYEALKREVLEEVAITIVDAKPLLRVTHDYDDKSVLLDVWQVDKFNGTPHGQEGQTLQWCAISDLVDTDFPVANGPIISALKSANYSI